MQPGVNDKSSNPSLASSHRDCHSGRLRPKTYMFNSHFFSNASAKSPSMISLMCRTGRNKQELILHHSTWFWFLLTWVISIGCLLQSIYDRMNSSILTPCMDQIMKMSWQYFKRGWRMKWRQVILWACRRNRMFQSGAEKSTQGMFHCRSYSCGIFMLYMADHLELNRVFVASVIDNQHEIYRKYSFSWKRDNSFRPDSCVVWFIVLVVSGNNGLKGRCGKSSQTMTEFLEGHRLENAWRLKVPTEQSP